MTALLPHQPTTFVGRESEIVAALPMLDRTRLVTLTGPGGVGKTRMSLEVAKRTALSYPDGVRFLDLSAVDASGVDRAVTASISSWLSHPTSPGDDIEVALEAIGRRRALVVLDNCEHVLAAAERVASRLVGLCPGVVVLATSREPLGAPGEVVWRLAPLPSDEACLLFTERARLLLPEFELDDATREAVTTICDGMDCLPLGIELAAAWVATLPVTRIARELDGRLQPLEVEGARNIAGRRHHTLTAALDWSYGLLEDTDRSVLNHLWVFAGWFHLDAALAVCAGVADQRALLVALRNLVSKSLVIADPRAEQPWYRLLETVREYCRRRFDDEAIVPDEVLSSPADQHTAAVLIREGTEWLVGLPGRELRLPDLRGLHYLHLLLSRCGQEVLASELAGRPSADRHDAGPVIDARARAAYEQRIRELRGDVDDARERNDVRRAAALEDELDQLVQHLAAALGRGGKVRRARSGIEQDRSSVTKAIRAAIARIEAHEPALGKHLNIAVRTGTYCAYQPEGASAVTWTL